MGNLKWILACLGSFGIGLAAGIKMTKEKAFRESEKEVERIREMYDSSVVSAEDEMPDYEKYSSKNEDEVPERESREEIKKKLIRNHEQTTNYAAMYHPETSEDSGEVEVTEDEQTAYNMFQDDKRRQEMAEYLPIEIINETALPDVPSSYGTNVWHYWVGNDIMCDDDDNVVEDYERLIGQVIKESEFADSSDEIMYVLNHDLQELYEIEKLAGAWEEY